MFTGTFVNLIHTHLHIMEKIQKIYTYVTSILIPFLSFLQYLLGLQLLYLPLHVLVKTPHSLPLSLVPVELLSQARALFLLPL